RMAMADSGVGAHHVDVALAFGVPQISAFAPRQHDRQRVVVMRGITRFAFHDVHDGTSSRIGIWGRRRGGCGCSWRPVQPKRVIDLSLTTDSAVSLVNA